MNDIADNQEHESIGAALEAAWDQHESGGEVDDAGIDSSGAQDQPPVNEGPGEEAAAKPAVEGKTDESGVRREPKPEEGRQNADSADDSPPMSLPPAAREAWKDTPPAMREAIAKREADYEAGIVKYADNARRAEQMDQALGPFQQYFAMDGGNPAATITGLLQTASLLQMGTPQQKATAAAEIINRFGVDIQTLDNVLAGSPAPQGQRQQGQQAMTPEAIRQMIQRGIHEGVQQYESRQQLTSAQQSLEAFRNDPKHEFYNDVAPLMADIIDVNHRQGKQLTYEEAYDMACQMRPDIQAILQARQNAPTPAQRQAATGDPGAPGGGTDNGFQPQTTREHLEAAWDMHAPAGVARI